MALFSPKVPPWVERPPSQFDIVACYFPERGTKKAGLALRPALVTKVLQNRQTGKFACVVAFGTKNLKIIQRQHLDLIIQNASHLRQLRLAVATRFDLDFIARLPWTEEFFGCWGGFRSPVISTLTEDYIKDYAFLMMRRGALPN